ncbi:MAG: lactonase family protein [Zetaproteobacteria bacterium]|nr:MAG: lactonase family protein [Zetaproteobacteria bacterium]
MPAPFLARDSARAATYVYVSSASDGDISMYTMTRDGTLQPCGRIEAGRLVSAMSVSPDKRFLFAAVRSQPYTAIAYAIDRKTGVLTQHSTGPLAENLPYICTDKTGRYLLGASYGGNLISVNPIGKDGKVGKPKQVIPTARNAHSIVPDRTNRYVYAPHLGTDQIFQFRFDARIGKLTANTPPIVQLKAGHGPRHIVVSDDNRFAYVLTEMSGVVVTFALDPKTGLLTQVSEASALPPDTTLRPGAPRGPAAAGQTPRDVSNDVWASDLHLTPDGTYLCAAERTGSTINTLSVDAATGTLTYLASTPTEKQPRGFRIHPDGKFVVVSGEKSVTISVYAIEAGGRLKLLGKYPTGKGSTWVEIVSVD